MPPAMLRSQRQNSWDLLRLDACLRSGQAQTSCCHTYNCCRDAIAVIRRPEVSWNLHRIVVGCRKLQYHECSDRSFHASNLHTYLYDQRNHFDASKNSRSLVRSRQPGYLSESPHCSAITHENELTADHGALPEQLDRRRRGGTTVRPDAGCANAAPP